MLLRWMLEPVLAADFTQIAITLVLIFFAAMKALFEANKAAPAPKRGPIIPPPDPAAPAPKPQPAAGQQADQLRSQVEEFLRRAGRPPQPGQPQQPTPQPRPASEIELLVIEEPRRSQSEGGRPPVGRTGAPAPEKQRGGKRLKRRQSVAEHVSESVAEHVAQSVAARSATLSQKTSRLGQRIVAEDQEFDEKLKAKFDHTLGTLGERSSEPPAASPAAPVSSPAAQIAAMLANPDGVRQAIILNEILHRPSDNW